MKTLDRRQFLRIAGAASAFAAVPAVLRAGTARRVVVIGGGFGGATVAKYLRMWGGDVQVTLVDANPSHVSCILSNLVVTGDLSMSGITIGYDKLKSLYGVDVRQGTALALDPEGNKVTVKLSSGATEQLPYDHLVLSPGIDFVPAPGTWDKNLTPHAWQAGPQTTLLKNQLAAMRNNELFVMTIPKAPYRCPPGPYERACVVADYLKRKGRIGAKVIVLDANSGIVAEPEAFGYAFNVTHAGVIEYYSNATVQSVDSTTRSIVTSAKSVSKAKVLNYIPNQKAGAIAATLADASGFVPVNPLTYATAKYPNIHVIGDSCAVPASVGKGVPKSGHMANSEAKVCADAMIRSFAGLAPDQDITTNSACYSPITNKTASWLSANYIYGDIYESDGKTVKGKGMHRVDLGEAPPDRIDGDSFESMFKWSQSLFSDSFA